jgi:hypothetical protein
MTKPFKAEMGSNQTIKNYILAIQALKIISGEEQCADNTLSNVEIARITLEEIREKQKLGF